MMDGAWRYAVYDGKALVTFVYRVKSRVFMGRYEIKETAQSPTFNYSVNLDRGGGIDRVDANCGV